MHLTNHVVVIFEDGRRKMPFDVREIRLKKASEQLEAIVGHRIEFHIRRAVMPQYEDSFEGMLIESIEAVARDARKIAERHDDVPELLAALDRIDVRYDASLGNRERRAWEFDVGSKTLTVRLNGHASSFVPEGLVYRVLADARREILGSKFAGVSPSKLAPGQKGAYLEYLGDRTRGPYDDGDASAQDLEAHPDLEALELGRQLHASTKDADLRAAIAAWQAEHGAKLFYGHLERNPRAVKRVAPKGAYAEARRQWAGWVRENLWSLDESKRGQLLDHVFPRDPKKYEPIPGLEPMRVGFAIIDRWIATGHEGPNRNVSPGSTFNEYVCPVDLLLKERLPFRNNCAEAFYRNVWASEGSKRTFVRQLVKRGDVPLYRAATASIHAVGGPEAVLDLWNRVERNEKAWRAVGTEVAVLGVADTLLDDLQAMWRKSPSRRGTLLYILALHARSGYQQKNFWPDFKKDFSVVDARTFAAYIDHGPHALATAWVTWPALGSFDRGTSIAGGLAGLFDAGQEGRFEHEGFKKPVEAVEAIVEQMCTSGTSAERRKVEAALRQRSRKKPAEAKDLARLQRRTRC